ncbi:MAG: hypothetical protein Q7U38_14230 [Methylobacter sp.]|nr:hypothetical protein [Methylobacter sp.]MDP2169655.1 hypothetical protein [Rhodocyclaceae bacterium]MDP2429032.1 hypothetical protein [Methylobacter sp.]MDP3056533.1 hypothetical protein [Methylobacter sp.]MDP3362022.1 hypothetical protein [Methylobacter sp.]
MMDDLMTREDIAALLGKSRAFTAELLMMFGAPPAVCKKNRSFMYRRVVVMEWLATEPYQRHLQQVAERKRAVGLRLDRARPSALDQALALQFLTGRAVAINTGRGLEFY